MKKRKHIGLIMVTAVLIVGAGALFIGRNMIVDGIRTKAAKEIGKKLLEEQFGSVVNIGEQELDISSIIENMDEADMEKVTDIAEKYISGDNIQEAAGLVQSGDIEGLKDMAREQLTVEDKAELQNLYEKYKDQINGAELEDLQNIYENFQQEP